MKKVGNRIKIEFFKKDDKGKVIERLSKFTRNGIQKSNKNYDSYTFMQNEVLMDNPNHLGFAVLELDKLPIYES